MKKNEVPENQRGNPRLGGFAHGISADEIININKSLGNSAGYYNHPSSILDNAARRDGFYNKSASIIRDIAGGHAFKDANKRTAQMTIEELMKRNNIVGGPSKQKLRNIINRVANSTRKDHLNSIEDIAIELRGY